MGSDREIVRSNTEVRKLTAAEFQTLAEVPPEAEWFANLTNPNTRRAYRNDVYDFMGFTGLNSTEQFRTVKRAHLLAWRRDLENRTLEPTTIRRKLSAVASLFDYLCDANAVNFNPVDGVSRPRMGANEGKSPALSDDMAKALLEAPNPKTYKGIRDRAILSCLLFHGLRRAEVSGLRVGDVQNRRGVMHFRVEGKGGKIRYVPVHPHTLGRIIEYLELSAHGEDQNHPLFQHVKPGAADSSDGLTGNGIYKCVVKFYGRRLGLDPSGITVHGLRATSATNALENEADIAKVQEWLGHSSISTTRLYDRRRTRPEDSPTFKVQY